MKKIMKKSFYMYVYVHDRVQRSNAVVYRVVYKPDQSGISCNMDRSRRAGIGQWHEYDHVACNKDKYRMSGRIQRIMLRNCLFNAFSNAPKIVFNARFNA